MRLAVLSGPSEGKTFPVSDGVDTLTIGRDTGCAVVISDKLISRRHGTIEITRRGVVVYSDHSHNGTYYQRSGDDKPTETLHKAAAVLTAEDRLLMGRTTLVLVHDDEDTTTSTTTTTTTDKKKPRSGSTRTPTSSTARTPKASVASSASTIMAGRRDSDATVTQGSPSHRQMVEAMLAAAHQAKKEVEEKKAGEGDSDGDGDEEEAGEERSEFTPASTEAVPLATAASSVIDENPVPSVSAEEDPVVEVLGAEHNQRLIDNVSSSLPQLNHSMTAAQHSSGVEGGAAAGAGTGLRLNPSPMPASKPRRKSSLDSTCSSDVEALRAMMIAGQLPTTSGQPGAKGERDEVEGKEEAVVVEQHQEEEGKTDGTTGTSTTSTDDDDEEWY